ncbi:MAG: Hpt domain-containing protein [Deltaproteobacteria bacterium]|jgi:chemotaxis protein histidine kinase CheA|nr:Hpt domain-containing protein [Deltaproteobacteria bacterium]
MSNDILEEFIFDSRDHLTTAGTQLLALEKTPDSLENLNALMGTLHTIKGNSGFVNLQNLYNLLHAAETLLQTVRETGCLCPASVIDRLFQVLDTGEAILGQVENGEGDEVDWLSSLREALNEEEANLEKAAALANEASLAEPLAAEEATAPAPAPAQPAVKDAKPNLIPIGPTLTLANGQLAEWGSNLLASCAAARANGQATLAVDLSGLSQLSSPEMALLVSLADDYGQDLALVLDPAQQADFDRILDILDLTERFRLYPDAKAALASLSQ